MTLRTKLLGAGAALLLSAGAAAAMPAVAQTDLNVRSGPGTQYPVVGSIPAGETVEAGNCTGSWCQVSFSGGSGYAKRGNLAMAGAVPGVGVAVAPAYTYDDDYAYAGGYYDDGYYGPGVGVFVDPRFHRRHGWNGGRQWNGNANWNGNRVGSTQGTWQGTPNTWQGTPNTWQGTPNTLQGRTGGGNFSRATPGSVSPVAPGNAGAGFNRGAGAQMSAPVGLPTGGAAIGGSSGGGAGAIAGPPAASGAARGGAVRGQ